MPWTKLVADQQENQHPPAEGSNTRILTYEQAVTEAMAQAMEIDPKVIILGEGVDTAGYIYNTTAGLSERFGKERVIETPIAEQAMTGFTLGAAIAGLRPVLIHMRNDFMLVSMDQIINHIAHWQKVFGHDVPLIIRSIVARGWGSGAQHSQSFHSLFAQFEGLDVVMPASPYDVKGLFLSAVASPRPTLIFEHRWLYQDKGYVPENPYTIPLGKAAIRGEGSSFTVVGMSIANRDIAQALANLAEEGITADWLDLRSVSPLDMEAIYTSVAKTGKLLVVENGPVNCGVGAEVAARVNEHCWEQLKAPVMRIGWEKSTVPAGPMLEKKFYPTTEPLAFPLNIASYR